MRKLKPDMKQRGLWDKITGKQRPVATGLTIVPVALGLRQVSLKALPGPDVRLKVTGRSETYAFKQVMECGAEYTYLLLSIYSERNDQYGEQLVVPLERVLYAE